MASKYVVEQKETGLCDVWYAQVFPKREIAARYRDLVENGWTPEEAQGEVAGVNLALKRCNEKDEGYGIGQCLEFVASGVRRLLR
jgi:hypothetical protein